MTQTAFRAQIFHLLDDPHVAEEAVVYHRDGLLIIEDGHIRICGPWSECRGLLHRDTRVRHMPDYLIVPGFVDTHIHYPQVDIIAAYGKQLMDWLTTYTFPEEARFSDRKKCQETAGFFLDELLRNGTTTALVFGTVHEVSADVLFEQARARHMRLIAGKVLMDRNAPDNLLDGPDRGQAATERLIRKWHGKDRLGYAITPRFAPTSTPAQLELAGRLKAAHRDVHVHTHMCETKKEIATVAALFPDSQDYLDVYARYGLVGDKTVLAHGIHMGADMCRRIARAGAAVALCPTSNLFMGSGLFNLARLRRYKIRLGLGTDVGGGTSFSQFATMKAAYEVAQLRGTSLGAFEAFYLATLGGARSLGLEKHIGNFEPGKEADFVVLDLSATPLMARRLSVAKDLHETLFALMILGDDRVVSETFVMGQSAYKRRRA